MYSRKNTGPKYIELSKNKTRIGIFARSQKSFEAKIIQALLFKKNELRQLEKRKQAYHGEKEGKTISAIRTTVIHDAENFGLVAVLEITSYKD